MNPLSTDSPIAYKTFFISIDEMLLLLDRMPPIGMDYCWLWTIVSAIDPTLIARFHYGILEKLLTSFNYSIFAIL
jgi:hypothetical protein